MLGNPHPRPVEINTRSPYFRTNYVKVQRESDGHWYAGEKNSEDGPYDFWSKYEDDAKIINDKVVPFYLRYSGEFLEEAKKHPDADELDFDIYTPCKHKQNHIKLIWNKNYRAPHPHD